MPSSNGFYGAEADRIPLAGGLARVSLGDFAPERLDPQEVFAGTGNVFPLVGGAFRLVQKRTTWAAYAGESKDPVVIEGRETVRPVLVGADVLTRMQRFQLGAGVTVIDEPAYFDQSVDEDRDALGRVSLYRVLTPWASLFAEGFATIGSDLGFRAGANYRSLNGHLNGALYSFDGEFPIAPGVRPGETGVELGGSYRPSELSSISGNVYWISEDVATDRDDFRGYVVFGKSFGSNAPHLSASYSREELTTQMIGEDDSRVADRFVASIGRASLDQFADLRLEHVANQGGGEPDRTQAFATYYRYFASEMHLNGSAVWQREEGGDSGFTAEAAIEAPWRRPYYFVFGLGGALVERSGEESGEGVVRIGLSRHILRDGVYGRIEARLPVDVGLPDSNLNRETYAFQIGVRYGWRQYDQIGAFLTPILRPSDFGAIEGSVNLEGKGLANVPILVQGRQAAITGAGGSFRISRVPVGSVTVSVDASSLEPGLAPVGDATQLVVVAPRQTARADFSVGQFRSLRGSVVVCENGRVKGVPGVRLALTAEGRRFQLETGASGSFQADDIPPGIYELSVDPASVAEIVGPAEVSEIRIDLREDVLAEVIRLRCPGN